MVMKLLFIGLGGFLGAILRFLTGTFVQTSAKAEHFPIGTLVVNLIGCFGLSFFFFYLEDKCWVTSHHTAFLLTGFFGAFTTFSTFELELFTSFTKQHFLQFFAYLSLSILGGFSLVFLGKTLADIITK